MLGKQPANRYLKMSSNCKLILVKAFPSDGMCLVTLEPELFHLHYTLIADVATGVEDFLLPRTNTNRYKASFLPSALSVFNENYTSH